MSNLFTNWNSKKVALLIAALVVARYIERKYGKDELVKPVIDAPGGIPTLEWMRSHGFMQ